jgi:NADPH:quinone reductase-like Zn-dependent oxidoreductase
MAEMLSITTATSTYSDPSQYQLSTVPRSTISRPNDVLIRVHAASVNPIDLKLAAGLLKYAVKDE